MIYTVLRQPGAEEQSKQLQLHSQPITISWMVKVQHASLCQIACDARIHEQCYWCPVSSSGNRMDARLAVYTSKGALLYRGAHALLSNFRAWHYDHLTQDQDHPSRFVRQTEHFATNKPV